MSIQDEIEKLRTEIEEDQNSKLKIALFGQPGAGKSSLINLIVGEEVAVTGATTDVTVEAKLIEYKDLLFVDLPGYGTSKFPPNQWMQEFKPKELDLFLCVFSGKLHESDSAFFKQLKETGRVCLFVRNKHDEIWQKGKTIEELEADIVNDVQKHVGSREPVYFVSCRNTGSEEDRSRVSALVDGIYNSLGPAKKDKYIRTAKAYSEKHLEAKHKVCEKMVYKYAGLAAANAINIVPVLNVGVDLAIVMKLFAEIRKSYGLSDQKIENLSTQLLPVGKKVIDFASKEGVQLLLKRYVGTEVGRTIAKYVPFVGTIISATAGYGITLKAGLDYLNDCHELAKQILKTELQA